MVLTYLHEVGKFDFFITFIIINSVGRASREYASFVLAKLPTYFISTHARLLMNQLLISLWFERICLVHVMLVR